ncbi:TonB-dependent siderophore receptor [Erythrobacter arachoides]|uniref:TonB-dependent siderophore receptor n=1 Tax=Aurantiacibacter arachoides TaxID=1850444 RepID=A0A845A414_9SPHN|nr:TonB-dependent receptor [Aurantiacibacter arachoides]MXO92339.1 TonB-dependent siderophore receptor [Aurantiacibacter arachoides]GGD57982.1 TonB-dependent receptor [Aurantiacibacter arachoides]
MTLRFAASTLALAAAIAQPAAAQEEGDAIVVTAQRDNATEVVNGGDAGALGNVAAEDLPFNIRSFDETLIYNQQPLTIGEVLENDPTVRTTYGFGNAAEQFVIRGFSLFGDDVGVNGLYGVAPRQLIAPELFGQVQVLNGASAFLNGAAPGGSGLGGSVNLLLKRADEDLTRATATFVGDGHIGGSFDVARRFGAGGEWGVRVNGAYRDGEVSVDREDRRAQVLGGAFDYDGGAFRAALDLAYQEVRIDSLRPKVSFTTATLPAVPDASANYAQDYTYTELTDVFGTLALEYDLAEDVLLYGKAGARRGDEEGIYGGIQVTDAVTGAATSGFHSYIPYEQNAEAVEAGLRASFATGGLTHTINAGGNMVWQQDRTAYDFFTPFDTNLYDPVQVAIQPRAFAGGDLDNPFPITEKQLGSVFASDTLGFLGDSVLLTLGARWQSIDVESFSYFGGALTTEYTEDAVTPVAGLVVKPMEGLSLYANYIEALQQGAVAPLDPDITNPGEVLAPRMTTQYEVGGKFYFDPSIFATLALYQIERPGDGFEDDGAGGTRFAYLGEQRNRGVEFTLNGEVAQGLRVIAGLALAEAELESGLEAPGVPELAANANVEWDLPFAPGLTLNGRVTHTGEQQANAANTLQLDSWTVFDLGARYVFAAGEAPVTLRLTVDNVTDEAYWASAFDAFNPALLQGTPRTVKASASIAF